MGLYTQQAYILIQVLHPENAYTKSAPAYIHSAKTDNMHEQVTKEIGQRKYLDECMHIGYVSL